MDKWNLKPLFESKEILENNIQENIKNSQKFEDKYKNQMASLQPLEFEKMLREYEEICENLSCIMTYAYLCFAANTKEGALLSKCEMEVNKAQEKLLFFEIEFNALPNNIQNSFIKQCKK